MKKITLIVALFCSISAFSTRYLVDGDTSKEWRSAGAGEQKVSLLTSLNYWCATNYATLAAGDEIWVAAGTYLNDGTMALKPGVSIYGGFFGTETAISQRAMVSGGKPWEFVNPTILDGDNESIRGIVTAPSTVVSYIDGLTITKCDMINAEENITGVGAAVMANWVMQNCIVSFNTFKNSINQIRGAGVYVKGGKLLNCYIHHNQAIKGTTGTGSTYGGGIGFAYNENPSTVVKGCVIESNISTSVGGGMANLDGTGGSIEDCIFKSNSCEAGNGGAIGTSASATAGNGLVLKNNQFLENTAFGNGGAVYYWLFPEVNTTIENSTFIGNVSAGGNNGGGALCLDNGKYTPIKRCIFKDNKLSAKDGSAIFGGVPNITLQNCLVANNTAVENGKHVVMLYHGGHVQNCTFVNNVTLGSGSALSFNGSVATASTLTNSVFWGNYRYLNGETMVYRDVYGYSNTTTSNNVTDGGGIWGVTFTNNITTLNSTENNTFVSPTTFKGAPADATQKAASAAADWSLLATSPAVDAGLDLSSSEITTDILGVSRPQGAAYDMGAYEYRVVSGIGSVKSKLNFSCFTANQHIELRNLSIGVNVSVYNVSGQLIKRVKTNNASLSIEVSKGLYLVQVADQATKIIVQ